MAHGRSIVPALIVAITDAHAPAASLTSPATPQNGFSFDGKWSCTVGGSWLQLRETNLEPAGYQGLYLIGYDKAKNQVVGFDANNFGSAIYVGPGWRSSALTLTSVPDLNPKALEKRFVFPIANASHFSVNWEVNQKNQWMVPDHLECSPEVHS
jgi:hypothetical protein